MSWLGVPQSHGNAQRVVALHAPWIETKV